LKIKHQFKRRKHQIALTWVVRPTLGITGLKSNLSIAKTQIYELFLA